MSTKKPSLKVNVGKWRELRAVLPADARLKVGVLAGAGGDEQVPGTDITLLELAAIHEFGSPKAGIPERSFVRSTFERGDIKAAVEKLTAQLIRGLTAGKLTQDQALEKLGAWAAAEIKRTIMMRLTTGPALAASTVARKGFSLPLFETGRLAGAITWLVTSVKPLGKKQR